MGFPRLGFYNPFIIINFPNNKARPREISDKNTWSEKIYFQSCPTGKSIKQFLNYFLLEIPSHEKSLQGVVRTPSDWCYSRNFRRIVVIKVKSGIYEKIWEEIRKKNRERLS